MSILYSMRILYVLYEEAEIQRVREPVKSERKSELVQERKRE